MARTAMKVACISAANIEVARKLNGVTFGIHSLEKWDGSIFVDIQQDWEDVHQRTAFLVHHIAAALAQ